MPSDLSDLCDAIAQAKTEIKHWQGQLDCLLDQLELAFDAGLTDGEAFVFNDWSYVRNKGRRSYQYPTAIIEAEAALMERKAVAVATGEAEELHGSPFWVIRAPK